MKDNLNETVTDLMHRATADLEPESLDLYERGVRRGMTLRRRRTAVRAIAGAGAVVASIAAVGGAYVLASEPGGEAPAAGLPAAPASTSGSAAGTVPAPERALQTLKRLLPDSVRVSRPELSEDTEGTINVAVLANDGKGPSQVSVQFGADNGPVNCADKPADRCRIRPDGSVIVVGGSRPGKVDPTGLVNRHVVVRYPNGSFIAVVSTNTTSPTALRPTRPEPVLSLAQLTTIADSKLWKFPPTPAGR
jgi:hypothetical protein